jgi:hypothetical protein
MKLTLSIPRSRPSHLTSFAAPEGCEAPLLKLDGALGSLVAERDPSLPIYHVQLPALEAGQAATFDVMALDDADAASGISVTDADGKLAIDVAGSPFMTFHHTTDYPKPVINPILTPKGVNMLREPMAAWSEGEHPWQRGLTLMQGAINGVDCWNERPNKEGFGRTAQDKMKVSHNPLSLLIESDNTWYEADRPLMTDSRSYRLFDTSRDAVVLDIALTLKASHGAVTIGDTKEGGFLCIRVNPTMDAKANGHMRNAYGATDEKGCWSFPSHWMDYYGPVGDETAGFAIFDHPQNFRYPTTWHVRGYGLFAPNCWMFKPDHHLAAGEELTFRWRVTIHSGDTDQADIANRFLDYVDGARVAKES